MLRIPVIFAIVALHLGGCVFVPTESPAAMNVHTVIPGVLIRGGQPGKSGLRVLRDEYGIRTVVNFNDLTNTSEEKAAAELGLYYLPLRDNPYNDGDNEKLIVSFLTVLRHRERFGQVYVHCKTGMDRTGIAIGVFRIVECNWTAEQTLEEQAQYQDMFHGWFFPAPAYLRQVERDREKWLALLDAAPDPPVVRPESAEATAADKD